MTETQRTIFDQMHRALANCGATSDLLCITGSFGDTLPDEEVLAMLQDWNADAEAKPQTPRRPRDGKTKRLRTMKKLSKKKQTWLDHLTLDEGAHANPNGQACLMEAVSYVAGETWSDHPQCVSPVIAAFCRTWNDSLSDEDRDRLLKPLILDLVGSRNGEVTEESLAWMATDWLVRVYTPTWLRLTELTELADRLEHLSPLNPDTCPSIQPTLDAVKKDAYAAGAAAWDAAGAAARAAAWAAAGEALQSTVEHLQNSALGLLRQMIETAKAAQAAPEPA